MLQVAPKIRTSAPKESNNDSNSAVDGEKEGIDDGRGRGGAGGRPSRVPRLDYNKGGNDEHVALQDVIEGDEGEEEGKRGDDSELLVISEEKDEKHEKVEGKEKFEGTETDEGDDNKVGDEGMRERGSESKSDNNQEGKVTQEKHEKVLLGSDAVNSTDASSSNNISPTGDAPGISPLGLLSSLPSVAPNDARGAAAVAARSLRDQRETKQQSIEYLAK